MLLHDLLDHGQSQANPEALRAEQRLKNPRQYIRRNSWTVVFKDHFGAPLRLTRLDREHAFPEAGPLVAFPGYRLTGVLEDIDHGSAEAVVVKGHARLWRTEFPAQLYALRQRLLVQ